MVIMITYLDQADLLYKEKVAIIMLSYIQEEKDGKALAVVCGPARRSVQQRCNSAN